MRGPSKSEVERWRSLERPPPTTVFSSPLSDGRGHSDRKKCPGLLGLAFALGLLLVLGLLGLFAFVGGLLLFLGFPGLFGLSARLTLGGLGLGGALLAGGSRH